MNNLKPTYEEIDKAVRRMAALIKDLEMEFGAVLALARGGLIPGVILSKALSLPLMVANYSSKRGNGDDQDHDNVLPIYENKKPLLIIDDICDTGRTLREVVDFYSSKNVSVYTAVLHFKNINVPPIFPDFRWQTIPQDSGWIVYPWE